MHYPVFLIIRYQTSQNKSSDCLNNNYKFLGSHCLIKHHNSLFQQPHLQQALDVPNRRLCKDVGLCRIPICKFYDLRCAILKIKPQLTPSAVVVCLIQVDSGGYFLFFFVLFTCFKVTVCTMPLSRSFRRSLSKARRYADFDDPRLSPNLLSG